MSSYSPVRARAHIDFARAQMEVAIADASERVDARFAKNASDASKRAEGFRLIANTVDELMTKLPEPADVQGPQLVIIYRAVECLPLVVDAFMETFTAFKREHGALIEPKMVETLDRFAQWAKDRPAAFREKWNAYVRDYEMGLEAAASELEEVADEWSAVDGDGLDHASDPG